MTVAEFVLPDGQYRLVWPVVGGYIAFTRIETDDGTFVNAGKASIETVAAWAVEAEVIVRRDKNVISQRLSPNSDGGSKGVAP